MNDIGGYFELELHKGVHHYHDTPYKMKSGRSALHCILDLIKPRLVYIPFYTCDALLEPFKTTRTAYKFYAINNLFDAETEIELQAGEYFLYVNYLDIKRDTVARLSEKYKDRLIVDATQAFFMKGNLLSWYFNSCRKFFGVPDGSYLYTPAGIPVPIVETRNESYITEHLVLRFNGHTSEGYEYFLENEDLADDGVSAMSRVSEYLLSGVDYIDVMARRRENFTFLHQQFSGINEYNTVLQPDNVPMFYPLLLDKRVEKSLLFEKRIFIPSFWKDVQERGIEGFAFEKQLSDNLWPLPVDHRYSLQDMELLSEAVLNLTQKR